MKNSKPKSISNFSKCEKVGHQVNECRSKKSDSFTTLKWYFYNYQKYGHREHEYRSKTKFNWTPKKQEHTSRKGNSYNWDYNTQYTYHYCGKYGHIPENCIKIHFRGNYKKWLNGEIVFISCLKVRHISNTYKTRAPTPSNVKEKVDEMRTWKEVVKGGSIGARKAEITQSNVPGDPITSN